MSTRRPAYALATILVLLGVALFGVGALVTISSLEAKVSRSQQEGVTAYYVADSGIADALWRLNNNATYNTKLLNGTLNVTYTATNVPQAGQGYTVTMVTGAQGAGYADVSVDATSNNGTFTARRQVITSVFAGQPNSNQIGTNGVMTGGNFATKSGVSSFNINNGGLYARGNVTFAQSNVSVAAQYKIAASGTYSASGSNIWATVSASNVPPAPTQLSVPGLNFSNYAATASVTYTPTAFIQAIKAAGNVKDFYGAITYISGNLNLDASLKNASIGIHGLLVVDGNFTIPNGTSNITINVYDPGNSVSGIVASKNVSISAGNSNINGVLYAAGTMSLTSLSSFNVSGAMISASDMTFTSISGINVNFLSRYTDAVFGVSGAAQALAVQHWEEEY